MDIRTGKTYESLSEALKDAVPVSDIAYVEQQLDELPVVTFMSGPFKNRVYRRTNNGLVRVDNKR